MGNRIVANGFKDTALPTADEVRQRIASAAMQRQAEYHRQRASGFVSAPCLKYVSAKIDEEVSFITRHEDSVPRHGIDIYFDDKQASACSDVTLSQMENLVQRLQANGFEATFFKVGVDMYGYDTPERLRVKWKSPV